MKMLKEEHILIVLIALLFFDFDITSNILIYFSSTIKRGLPFVNLHL